MQSKSIPINNKVHASHISWVKLFHVRARIGRYITFIQLNDEHLHLSININTYIAHDF